MPVSNGSLNNDGSFNNSSDRSGSSFLLLFLVLLLGRRREGDLDSTGGCDPADVVSSRSDNVTVELSGDDNTDLNLGGGVS